MIHYDSFRDFSCSRKPLTPLQSLLGYGFVWFGVFVVYFLVKVFSPAVNYLAWVCSFALGDAAFFVFSICYNAFYLIPYLAIGAGIGVSMFIILRVQKTPSDAGC